MLGWMVSLECSAQGCVRIACAAHACVLRVVRDLRVFEHVCE